MQLRALALTNCTAENFLGIPFDVPHPNLDGLDSQQRIAYWNSRMYYWRRQKQQAERRLADLRAQRAVVELTTEMAGLKVSSAICKGSKQNSYGVALRNKYRR